MNEKEKIEKWKRKKRNLERKSKKFYKKKVLKDKKERKSNSIENKTKKEHMKKEIERKKIECYLETFEIKNLQS